MTLDEGIKNEARLFGQCWTTQDNRIGLKNFVEKGGAAGPYFVVSAIPISPWNSGIN